MEPALVTRIPYQPQTALPAEDNFEARIVGTLASTLAGAIASAIRELRKAEPFDVLNEAVLKQGGRLEQLVERVSRHETITKQAYEQLLAATALLRDFQDRYSAEIHGWREETQEQLSSITLRLDRCEGDFTGLNAAVEKTSGSITAMNERLDRQANAIRSLYDMQTRREVAVHQLAEVLTQLRQTPVTPPTQL